MSAALSRTQSAYIHLTHFVCTEKVRFDSNEKASAYGQSKANFDSNEETTTDVLSTERKNMKREW
jgi:hypothetical protein